jgi:hypothetical protein
MTNDSLLPEDFAQRIKDYSSQHGIDVTQFCAELIHRDLPPAQSDEFHEMTRDKKIVKIEIPAVKVILIRDVSQPLPYSAASHCPNCAMKDLVCYTNSTMHPDRMHRDMPCEGYYSPRYPFKAYKMMDQTSRKQNGRKEYIPDTAESFDIKGTWNSVRTMIGMG